MSDIPVSKKPRKGLFCKAKSKRTGRPCGAFAMTGYQVCYHHGARGGAPRGERNGRYKHGLRSSEAIERNRQVRELIRASKQQIKAC